MAGRRPTRSARTARPHRVGCGAHDTPRHPGEVPCAGAPLGEARAVLRLLGDELAPAPDPTLVDDAGGDPREDGAAGLGTMATVAVAADHGEGDEIGEQVVEPRA